MDIDKDRIGRLFREYPIKFAYLYGSAAVGKQTLLSDVDIAIVTSQDLTGVVALNLELGLEVRLVDELDIRNADVRIINFAPLVVKAEVVQHGVLIYSRDEPARVDFEVAVRSEYFDFLPYLKKCRKGFLEAVRKRGLYGKS